MKIKKKISTFNHSSRNGKSIEYIVIHWVGAVSKASDNARYFAAANRNASAHYFVDENEIWQSVEDSRAAWHCGGNLQGKGGHKYHKICSNSNSIGIELCCKRDKNGKLCITETTIKNAAGLVKKLMKKYKIPENRVIRHYDVTGKQCPGSLIFATPWEKAKSTMAGQHVAKTPPKKEKTTAKNKVPTKNLKKGDEGEQVKNLQRCLNKCMSAELKVDGSFGPATESAVKAFQKKHGLNEDGLVGPKTKEKMKQVLETNYGVG